MRSLMIFGIAAVASFLLLDRPAQASCEQREVYTDLAHDAYQSAQAYQEEGQTDLMNIALADEKHWDDMASLEYCYLDKEVDEELARQHKANAAAAWAKKHPSKYSLSHPKPHCKYPNVEAATVNAVAPNTPPEAQSQGITGIVNVVLNIDKNGKIVGTPTIQSSPSQLLNAAAIEAAQKTTFRAEIKNCVPVAATYIFAVEFNNN